MEIMEIMEITDTELVRTELAVAFVRKIGATSRGPVLQTTEINVITTILKNDTGRTTIQLASMRFGVQ